MFAWSGETGLAALFASAFLSATILPGNSEVVLFAVLKSFPDRLPLALAIATLGNTLGSLTTFALGRAIPKRFPEHRAVQRMRRYGPALLLLAWVPIAGDALCGAAGWLRMPWLRCTAYIALGKLARYAAVASLAAW